MAAKHIWVYRCPEYQDSKAMELTIALPPASKIVQKTPSSEQNDSV